MSCKNGGLIIQRHDELVNELSDLACSAFIP